MNFFLIWYLYQIEFVCTYIHTYICRYYVEFPVDHVCVGIRFDDNRSLIKLTGNSLRVALICEKVQRKPDPHLFTLIRPWWRSDEGVGKMSAKRARKLLRHVRKGNRQKFRWTSRPYDILAQFKHTHTHTHLYIISIDIITLKIHLSIYSICTPTK